MSRRGSRLYQVTSSLLVMLKFGRRIRYVMCECGSDVMDGPLGVELVSSFRARPIQCTLVTCHYTDSVGTCSRLVVGTVRYMMRAVVHVGGT